MKAPRPEEVLFEERGTREPMEAPELWTRENFDRRLHLKAPLPSTILREGRLLHGA
jgi:hypothetical protein